MKSKEPGSSTHGITKKCQEPKPAAITRDDKLKKIHKGSHHRKPAKTPSRLPEEVEEMEQPDPFRHLFKRVYSERITLNSLMPHIRKVEQLITPEDLAAFIVESMSLAVSEYRNGLNFSCIRIFNNTLKQEGGSVANSLTDFQQNRRNLIGLLHTIYEEFAEAASRNHLAVEVAATIAQKNPDVRRELEKPLTIIQEEALNYSFFQRLMDCNDMLRGICLFAQQLLNEQVMELTAQQRKELSMVVDLYKLGTAPKPQLPQASKRSRRKKKQTKKLTEQQLEQLQMARLTSQLSQMQVPALRLMVKFDDDFLLEIRRRLESG